MITIDTKVLIRLLTRTCTKALEGAVQECVNRRQAEVSIPHLLLGLLEDPESDASVLLDRGGGDAAAAIAAVKRVLDLMPGDHAGKPVISLFLLQAIEDAWHTVERSTTTKRVRSATLLAELAHDTRRYDNGPLLAQIMRMIPGISERGDIAIVGSREDAEVRLETPKPEPPRLPREVLVHRVARGETLISIARAFAIDVEDIARENNLGIRDPLDEGKTLKLRVLPRDIVPRTTTPTRLH